MSASCPVCKRRVDDGQPEAPFCGPRCRLIDLGRWLEGTYRIPDPDPAPTVEPPESGPQLRRDPDDLGGLPDPNDPLLN